jgi:hypothetical protein
MQTTIKRSPKYWTGLCRILAMLPWLALSACGDGGGGSGVGGGSAGVNTDPATALNGFYQASPGDKEFISLLLPIPNSSSVQWYGWYFKGASVNADPTLLSGVLDLGINWAAQSKPAGIRAFISGSLATGSASLSNASLTGFRANVPAVPGQTALEIDAVAATGAEYPLAAVASATALAGRWSGPWSSAGSVYGASTLTFSSTGGLLTNTTGFPCDVSQLSLVSRSAGNAFSASLVIPAATLCPWAPLSTPKTLQGIAFIRTPAGASRRLEVMLLDSDGRGISFRGDLQP